GALVPLFALFLLWQRRKLLAGVGFAPSWWGAALLAAWTGLRLVGARLFLPWVDSFSLVVCLAGLCALLGGPRSLRWSWPALAFLLFMLPLPYRFQTALAFPLQQIATRVS